MVLKWSKNHRLFLLSKAILMILNQIVLCTLFAIIVAAHLENPNLDVEFADDATIITKIQALLQEHDITNKKQLDSIVIRTVSLFETW